MKLNRWLMAATAGIAGLVVSGSFDPADARGRSVGARTVRGAGPAHAHAHTGPASRGRSDFGSTHHHRADPDHHGHADRGRRIDRDRIGAGVGASVDVPLAYGAYASGGGSCRSLRMRAEVTGSGSWWSRYRACLDGYDY